ncbi:MAG: cysteine synthase A [Lentisphaeria bacterium]|nr:cysteine synthase A [Lentisphaeria bacterium]
MEKIKNSILETVGSTPLVRINSLNTGVAEVLVKVESRNPGGSVKDRVGIAMVEDAEKRGLIKPGACIVEPTSGNTGIGLAVAAAVKGYKLILTMPDTMSIERRKLLAAFGAKIELTPGAEGMSGAIARAKEILAENPGSWMPQQFENPANPAAHYAATGPEIWDDCGGRIDLFVAGVGTGGTLSGVAKYLKEKDPAVQVVAVEPADSPLLSGGTAGPHKLQGIGANFIPATLDRSCVDRVIPVTDQDAGETARSCAAREGILIGISGGAALYAALTLSAEPENSGKRIVVLLPDSGERYLSSWLFAE